MSNDQFLQAFEELLEDQIDAVSFEKNNRVYAVKEDRKDTIMQTLKNLPETVETQAGPIKVHKLLLELGDLDSDLSGIGFDIAIKRGFSLAIKLMFHNLTA